MQHTSGSRAPCAHATAALSEYRSLFSDMDEHVATKWWPLVKDRLEETAAAA